MKKYSRAMPCSHGVVNGNVNTRKPHNKGTPQRAFRTHGGGCLLAGIKGGRKEGYSHDRR